jgi:uncharacterized protein (TIGR02270 family)
MPDIEKAVNHKNDLIRFWGNWSAVLLGQQASLQQLKTFVLDAASPYQDIAMQLCFRVLTVEQGRVWISELAKDESQIRIVIKATGILGDPHAVNWLISKMLDNKVAKLAGEAFSLITGADFVKHKLTIPTPIKHPMDVNNDSNDDYVGLDKDEHLPYPEQSKVAALWRNHGQKFIVGRRYFFGKTLTTPWLKTMLNNGNQRQRHAAAMELALNDNNLQFVNTRAKVLTL